MCSHGHGSWRRCSFMSRMTRQPWRLHSSMKGSPLTSLASARSVIGRSELGVGGIGGDYIGLARGATGIRRGTPHGATAVSLRRRAFSHAVSSVSLRAMKKRCKSGPMLRAAVLAALLVASSSLWSETLYVSDQFEVPLRTGETTEHAILKMLPSGTAVELLETDKGKGYSRVRTQTGVEGYMQSRYLMPEAAARDQLAALRQRLSSASDEQGGLSRQVDELGQQLAAAQRTITELTGERDQAGTELDRVKSVSAKSLELDERNRQLTQQLAAGEQRIRELSADNETLRRHTSRDWFLAGGGLVLFSMLLGIALTRVRWRRRSRYSDF